MKLKKTYSFTLFSSFYIALIVLAVLLGVFFLSEIDLIYVFSIPVLTLIASFFIIQYRVKRFIYRQVKKMYEDVSLLDAASFQEEHITTDMDSLTREVEKFAESKKMEIETLKVKENYRKELMGNVAHELKTPLFTVQGYILTLLDGAMKDKSVRKKYLQRAEKGVDRLIYIVKELDMITKFESGNLELHPEKINIIELVENVFDLLEMRAAKKDITLTFDKEYDESVFVLADQERIQQVLSNLMVNSIKYGKPGGTTEVSIEDLSKNKVLIRITDNGEGIEEKHLTRIFERFFRVDTSGSRREGGSGLGLSIVKHILEAHKQKIYVESELGVGSEFSFTLEKYKM